MKIKRIIIILLFPLSILQAQVKTNGYLSFDFIKGEAEFSGGSFRNLSLGIFFSGELTSRINYLAEVRFKSAERIEVEQGWLRLKPSEAFSLLFGVYLVPFGRYNQANRAHETLLINPPLPLENAYPSSWREIGVLIEGRLGWFMYSGYLGNGSQEGPYFKDGQQFSDNNSDKGKGGRLALSPSRGLDFGFSYYRGMYDEENKRELSLLGADLRWLSEGFLFLFEYVKTRGENPEGFEEGTIEGYFIQASFDLGRIRSVLSYQRLDYEDMFHGQGFQSPSNPGEGISLHKRRWGLGLIYMATQNILLKLEYDLNREKEVELKDNTLTVQVAFNF